MVDLNKHSYFLLVIVLALHPLKFTLHILSVNAVYLSNILEIHGTNRDLPLICHQKLLSTNISQWSHINYKKMIKITL